jgi:hypothetical protein
VAVASWYSKLTAHRRGVAVAASVALHGTILYAVSQQSPLRDAPDNPRPTVRVVWLSDWPALAPPAPAEAVAPDEPPALVEPVLAAEPPAPAEAATAVEPPAPAEPVALAAAPTAPIATPANEPRESATSPDTRPAEQSLSSAETEPQSPSQNDGPTRPSPRDVLVDEFGNPIDFGALKQAAVDRLSERLNHQSSFATFTPEDSLEAVPIGLPPAEMSVFDAPDSPSASVLSPNQARTRAGRWLGELCNALTGGFGILGSIAVCADGEIYGQLFAHLKPEYMKKRPVCVDTQTGSTEGLMASLDNEISTVKCRLVYMDEWGLIDEATEEAAFAR